MSNTIGVKEAARLAGVTRGRIRAIAGKQFRAKRVINRAKGVVEIAIDLESFTAWMDTRSIGRPRGAK